MREYGGCMNFQLRRLRKPVSILLVSVYAVCFIAILVTQFPLGVIHEAVSFTDSKGVAIDAEIIRPADSRYENYQPVVVMVHGFCVSKEFFYALGAEFALRGFLVISISMPGHGLSEGPFQYASDSPYSAMSALDYVESKYSTMIDTNKVAIVGHSFGGYTVVKAAFLDPRFKVCVAIAAIFSRTNNSLVQEKEGMAKAGLDIPPEDLLPYLNTTLPQNLLALVGTQDIAAPPDYSQHIIGAATGVAWDAVTPGVLTGDFSLGTARKLAQFDSMDHTTEAYDPRSQNETISWVERSLALDTSGLSTPAGRGIGLLTYGAGFLGAAVGFLLLPFLLSYIAQAIYGERRDDLLERKHVDDKKLNWKAIGAWSLTFFACAGPLTWVVAGLSGGYMIFPTTTLIDRLTVPFLFVGSILVLVVLVLLKRKTAFGQQWVRRDTIWPEKPGRAALVGIISATGGIFLICEPLTLVFMNLFPLGPRLVPFVRMTLFCLVGVIGSAIVFRGIVGNHIMRRRGFWTGRFLASVVSGLVVGAAMSWCFVGTFGDILLGLDLPMAFVAYWVVLGVVLAVVDFLTTHWAYNLEGGVLSGTIVQALIFGILFSMTFPILP